MIHPALWDQPAIRDLLARRDISALYFCLTVSGLRPSQIAQLTGQLPSEVAEIVDGREVRAYDQLVQIAEGLGIPRGLMGLAYGPEDSPSSADRL